MAVEQPQLFSKLHKNKNKTKYLANGKYVFWAFMDLEKIYGYDRSARHVADSKSVWSRRKIVERGAESMHVDSRACVRVGMDFRE